MRSYYRNIGELVIIKVIVTIGTFILEIFILDKIAQARDIHIIDQGLHQKNAQ